ncbi:MAG: radical SAM protein, partial [Bdellovibrionota bacterium]
FLSAHPKKISDELIEVWPRITSLCEHVHLPVQSGSDRVLRRMKRLYTRDEYVRKVDALRKNVPGLAVTTDLIVGFPGETAEQFEDTVSLIREVKYDNIYAFKYSPRPFTKAAKFEDQVPEDEKQRRLAKLLEIQREIAFELAKDYDGKTYDVLIEGEARVEGQYQGRTSQNKIVYFPNGSLELVGKTLPIKVKKAFPNVLHGEIVYA